MCGRNHERTVDLIAALHCVIVTELVRIGHSWERVLKTLGLVQRRPAVIQTRTGGRSRQVSHGDRWAGQEDSSFDA